MGETSVAVGRLGNMTGEAAARVLAGLAAAGGRYFLHSEQMRRDEAVPADVG